MKFVVNDPNFSVIMPGGCNANCGFCFYKYNPRTEISFQKWLIAVETAIRLLPKEFTQISITGGEPTLNPKTLESTLQIVRKRFNKIVLTTNGSMLSKKICEIVSKGLVDYINISRHSHDQNDNDSIFHTPTANKRQLKAFVDFCHIKGVPVNINCVINQKLSQVKMVDFCKEIQAYSIKFRNIARDSFELDKINNIPLEEGITRYKSLYKERTQNL